MRLPLYILPDTTPEAAAALHPGMRVVLNSVAPPTGAITVTGCVCCTGRSELRDTLNSVYLDWAHDRDGVKGAILIPDASADIGDLRDFLEEDLMLRARFSLV